MSDSSGGAAAGAFVAIGVAYLAAEFIALVVIAAVVGVIIASIIALGAIGFGLGALWLFPPRSAKTWCILVVGTSTAFAAPYLIMEAFVLKWHSHASSGNLVRDLIALSCAGLLMAAPAITVGLWEFCWELDERQKGPRE